MYNLSKFNDVDYTFIVSWLIFDFMEFMEFSYQRYVNCSLLDSANSKCSSKSRKSASSKAMSEKEQVRSVDASITSGNRFS